MRVPEGFLAQKKQGGKAWAEQSLVVWLSSSASLSCGGKGSACILCKSETGDTDVCLLKGRSSPQTERRKRMCLQAATLSGQLQVMADAETVTTYAFPEDPNTMKMQLTGVLIMWKD